MDADTREKLKDIIVSAILQQAREDAKRIVMNPDILLAPKRRRKIQAESEQFLREIEKS